MHLLGLTDNAAAQAGNEQHKQNRSQQDDGRKRTAEDTATH